MPFHVATGGAVSLITEKLDQADIALEQRYEVYGYIGLVLLIVERYFRWWRLGELIRKLDSPASSTQGAHTASFSSNLHLSAFERLRAR